MIMYKLKNTHKHNYKLNPAIFIELRLVKPMLPLHGMLTSLKAKLYPMVSYSNGSLSQMVLFRILHKTWASGFCF